MSKDKTNSVDELGDRVKAQEKIYAAQKFEDGIPFCVRIDGKAFHTYTKGLARPYDARLSRAFIDSMNFLMEQTDAKLGYTQSDEISLIYFPTASYQTNLFGSRLQKLTSVLASLTTARFNAYVQEHLPEKKSTYALFDARVWSVPTLRDAAEVVVWRQEDAIKNAISMAASAHYSAKQLHKKSSKDKIQMLADKNVVWADYPDFFKSGTFARKSFKECPMPQELQDFKSNAQQETFYRSEIVNFNMPRLKHLDNFEGLLFDPVFEENQQLIARRNTRKKALYNPTKRNKP